MIDKFNIRVYGIALREQKVLLCREQISGKQMLKFPGGGLEFGEGLLEGLQREMLEESGLSPSHIEHFYTTDVFVQSAFKSNEQLISVYYTMQLDGSIPMGKRRLSDSHTIEFFWEDLNDLSEDYMTFPVDQLVIRKLILEKGKKLKTP